MYHITRGDLKITKNVLGEVARRLGDSLAREIKHFKYQNDCPSYHSYNNIVDILVYLDTYNQDLTS